VEENGFIRVMSYNVHYFKHVDSGSKIEYFADQVIDMVREKNPDVFCCQEFSTYQSGVSRKKCIEDFSQNTGLQYVFYNTKRNFANNVIFSKYPLEKVSEETYFGKEVLSGIMVSVDAGEKGRFFVANMHLVSYQITDGEINVLTNSTEHRDQLDTIGMSVARKLKYAFERRSDEIDEILESMPLFHGPIIMCGDFNDTPMSFTYRQMQKAGFVDSFTKVGRGIKPTYAGKLPLMRIDYIWGNEKVKPLKFKRFRYKASDHYPIMLDFSIQQ
jgi:endonuclease/exonuclease/phosphatase family metal-dependent hydrolase